MSRDWPHRRSLWHPHLKSLSLRSMWLGKMITIRLPSCRLLHSGLHQMDKRNDSITGQEVATNAEDHWDPENPDHSTSQVLCKVMSSYGQVWNPWRVEGGIVMNSFLTHFTNSFVSLCYPLICQTDTRIEYYFISYFVQCFICRLIIVSNIVSTIYIFEHIVDIVDIELHGSLASL